MSTTISNRAAMPKGRSFGWDSIGITASGLCVAHCILTPLLFLAIPVAGIAFLENELVHKTLVAVVILVGAIAFVPGLRLHGRYHLLLLISLGIGSLLFAAFVAEGLWGETGEAAFTMAGGALMIFSHWRNRTFCRACRICDRDSGCNTDS